MLYEKHGCGTLDDFRSKGAANSSTIIKRSKVSYRESISYCPGVWLGEELDPRNFVFYEYNGTLKPTYYEDGIVPDSLSNQNDPLQL